ncbi:MAG: SGNH/GDSL hydrolase family protein [Myxococcaceae bacterium]
MTGFLIRYVALGDSTGVGVGACDGKGGYVERLFQRARSNGLSVGLLNLCRNGATASTLVADQLDKAVRAKPTLVTLAVGGNDLWRGTSEAQYAQNTERTIAALASTGTRGIVINVPDLSHAPVAGLVPVHMYGPRLLAFNEALKASAAKHRFEYVDLFSQSRADLPGHPEYFCADGFHPSEHGYDRWTSYVWPTFERVARELSAPSASAPTSVPHR